MSGKKATSNIISGDYALSVGYPEVTLPKNWNWVPLEKIAKLATGHTPSKKIPAYWDGDIPWMSVGDARKYHGKKIYKTKEYTNILGLQNSAAVLLPENTVCLSRTASIGYSIILGKPMATSQGFVNWICSENLHPRFLQLLFVLEKRFLYSISEGTAHTTIYFPEVKALHIALPPYKEQQRIVNKIDEFFTKIDEIKNRIEKLSHLQETFFKSTFFKNNGFTTLEFHLTEKKDKVGSKWQKFRKIGVSAHDGITDLAIGTKSTFENYKIVSPGDFVYNTMRIDIGSVAIYEGDEVAITSPDYVVFNVSGISKYLLLTYLKSDIGRNNISSLTTGSVRSRLYFKNLSLISFPSLSQKQHIDSENLLKWFYINLKKLAAIKDNLLYDLEKSLLHKAYTGKLTEQLDSDVDGFKL